MDSGRGESVSDGGEFVPPSRWSIMCELHSSALSNRREHLKQVNCAPGERVPWDIRPTHS